MKFKKTMSILVCSTICLTNVSLNVYAEETTGLQSGDYIYSIDENGSACIDEYRGSGGDVVIPESIDGYAINALGTDAFNNTSVTTVKFNNTINSVGEHTFIDCYALTEIIVPAENKNFESVDGVLFVEDMTYVLCYPSAKEGSDYEIPEGVTNTGVAAFYETKLEEISFPSTLTNIDRHSFSYNQSLKTVDLSQTSVTDIGDMAFVSCTSLENVLFPETLCNIGSASFAECMNLLEVTIPEGVAVIGQNAFAATGLTEITIPSSVQEIGYCAFGYDATLTPIDSFIVKGVAGSMAETYATDVDVDYDYANNFTFVEVSEDTKEYEELDSIEYGDFMYAEVDGEAYITSCISQQSEIEVPAEINGLPVTVIYGAAFYQSSVETIILPDSIKRIELLAFYQCENLKTINLPEGLEEIMAQAFYGCKNLTEITIPSTCNTIGDVVFVACNKLKSINIASGNSTYKSIDGVLVSAEGDILYFYPEGKGTKYKIPNSVKTIADYAFSENSTLKEVNLNKVESIGIDAFSFCDVLKKVKMNDSVKTIGNYAFYECFLLEDISLSKNLEIIGEYAFYDCPSLKSVRLGDKLVEIGACAFGMIYDETSSETDLIDGFKIYAEPDSGGAGYAESAGLEYISGTIEIGNVNISKMFVIVVGSIIAGCILLFVIILIVKKSKAKTKTKDKKKDVQNSED